MHMVDYISKVLKGMATMTWAGLRSLIDMPLTLPISRWILLLSFKLKPKLVSSRFENFADLLLAEKNADVFIVTRVSLEIITKMYWKRHNFSCCMSVFGFVVKLVR